MSKSKKEFIFMFLGVLTFIFIIYHINIFGNDVNIILDKHGNPKGSEYDLAENGAFDGYTIAVLHLCTSENFSLTKPKKALEEKGFKFVIWENNVPNINEFKSVLSESCQLWIISSPEKHLNDNYLREIKDFFDDGNGLYLWGDNDPYFADANYVGNKIFKISMHGNLRGDKIVKKFNNGIGFIEHDITQNINNLYEGITIATINDNKDFSPLIYGSEGNIVVSIYDKDGKRAIIDGGFTRLHQKFWEKAAGTERYVKNATSWLVNRDDLLQ